MSSRKQRIAGLEREKAMLKRNCLDEERLYQYFEAQLRQEMAQKPPLAIYHPHSVASIDDDGTRWFKPPRFLHRSRLVRLMDRITRWIDPHA